MPDTAPDTLRAPAWRRALRALALWFDTGAAPADDGRDPDRIDWLRVLPFVGLHLACLGVLWVGFSWFALWTALALYALLAARGHFRVEGWLAARLAKQLAAALAMGATIWLVGGLLEGFFSGSVGQRLLGTVALIGAGSTIYFALAWITGGMDREDLLVLLRRKKVEE